MSDRADLDVLLDQCLAALHEGQPIEACLAGVDAADRRELEALLRVADLLRQAPRESLSAAASGSHERRLLKIAAQRRAGWAATRPKTLPLRNGHSSRLLGLLVPLRPSLAQVAAVCAVVAASVLSGGAGSIVNAARPDEALYNVKLTWEQTQLLLARSDAQRARVFIHMAQARLSELEELAREGRPIPDELVVQVRLHTSQALSIATELPARDSTPLLRQISELLSYERILLTRFLASLPEPERATVEVALTEAGQAQATVRQALQERVEQQVPVPTFTPGEGASPDPASGGPGETSGAGSLLPTAPSAPSKAASNSSTSEQRDQAALTLPPATPTPESTPTVDIAVPEIGPSEQDPAGPAPVGGPAPAQSRAATQGAQGNRPHGVGEPHGGRGNNDNPDPDEHQTSPRGQESARQGPPSENDPGVGGPGASQAPGSAGHGNSEGPGPEGNQGQPGSPFDPGNSPQGHPGGSGETPPKDNAADDKQRGSSSRKPGNGGSDGSENRPPRR